MIFRTQTNLNQSDLNASSFMQDIDDRILLESVRVKELIPNEGVTRRQVSIEANG